MNTFSISLSPELPPPVDLARQGFDGPKFMAEMTNKLWAKK